MRDEQLTVSMAYHSRFIPEGVAESPKMFLGDAYVLPKLFSYE
jgi:hypothetical protein